MPLAFESTTHGTVAFGFFNIASDMLLLKNRFFFSDRFCSWISALAAQETTGHISVEVLEIPDPEDIGDLMGAIHGFRFTGFIGKLYTRFPFPPVPEEFKQDPDGHLTRDLVRADIAPFSRPVDLTLALTQTGDFTFGPFGFSRPVFHDLIRYVWQGGYPRWRDEVRPSWVLEMKAAVRESRNPNFSGVFP